MKFDINNYKGKYVMHCKTEEEARDFCNYLHSVGRKWSGGYPYSDRINYYENKEKTAYNFNEGMYADIKFYKTNGYTILEWEDFMNKEFTKADLRTGDVILRRNGDVEIVNRELKMLICQSGGWNDLDNIREDLTNAYLNKNRDIVEVRRPTNNCDCCFDAMSICRRGTLVYERKEVEEMTLAEVCKLLGKEIKIIK